MLPSSLSRQRVMATVYHVLFLVSVEWEGGREGGLSFLFSFFFFFFFSLPFCLNFLAQVWGSEYWHSILRRMLAQEMSDNAAFYQGYGYEYEENGQCMLLEMEKKDWEDALHRAGQDQSFLDAIHILALSHVLKRPIILYCSEKEEERFGGGASGVASGTYIPLRFDPSECIKAPIVIAWSGKEMHHFVPLVGMENFLAPPWPLTRAGFRKFQDRLDSYVTVHSQVKLNSQGHPVFKAMDEYLRLHEQKQQKAQEEMMEALRSALGEGDNGEPTGRRFMHPETGERFEDMLKVGPPPYTRYLGYNSTDDFTEVQNRFFAKHPELESHRDLVNKTMLGSRKRARDGVATKTPGVCDCGFKHMVGEREVDFVLSLGLSTTLGWDVGEDIFESVDSWLSAFKDGLMTKSMPGFAAWRFHVLKQMVSKEGLALRMQFARKALEKGNETKLDFVCHKCRSPVSVGKYQVVATCTNCKAEAVRPDAKAIACPVCGPRGGFFSILEGQIYFSCDACNAAFTKKSCMYCSGQFFVPLASIGAVFPCVKCKKWQPSGIPETVDRLVATFPELRTRQYAEPLDRRVFASILAFNNKMEGTQHKLQEPELAQLQALQQVLMSREFATTRLGGAEGVTVVTERLLGWPLEQRHAVLDVLRVMLLNPQFLTPFLNDSLVAKILAVQGADWRCRFVAFKCICNIQMMMMHQHQGSTAPAAMLRYLDAVLDRVDLVFSSSKDDPKGHSLVAAAGALFNFSTVFARRGDSFTILGSEDQRGQLLTAILLALGSAVKLRDGLLAEGLFEAASQHASCMGKHQSKHHQAAVALSDDFVQRFSKVDEVLCLLAQSFGNILSAFVDREAFNQMCMNMQFDPRMSVWDQLMESDPAVYVLFENAAPKSTKFLRLVLRDIWACMDTL